MNIKNMNKCIIVGLIVLCLSISCGCQSKSENSVETVSDVPENVNVISSGNTLVETEKVQNPDEEMYGRADELFCLGEYNQSAELYEKLGNYKDSKDRLDACYNQLQYEMGCQAQEEGNYDLAAQHFTLLGSFLDSSDRLGQCIEKLRETDCDINPYLNVLNSWTGGTDISVKPHAYANIDKVIYADLQGAVSFILKQDGSGLMLKWISNSFCDIGDLQTVRDCLERDLGDSFWDVDEDCGIYYYWENELEYDLVGCTLENGLVNIYWCRYISPQDSDSKPNYVYNKCDACSAEATKSIELFGREVSYCETHYSEVVGIVGKMEADVGRGSASKHHCEVCSKEGTRSIVGISGLIEYYCTEHYYELQELWEDLNKG